jgi:hypothetical protein
LPGFFFGLRLRGIFATLESNHHGTADDSERMCYAIRGRHSQKQAFWHGVDIASGAFYMDDLAIHR